ncbi:MAG: extracellular solute-binding protein, partial [Solobacterium sp.]|nr:extracellular solute-binding protein [Solobacterium sp.]
MAQILNNTYEILDYIGKGGMSTVFKARHIRLDTPVAIKSVRKDQAGDLLAEVSILKKLNHPNLVRVIDVFEDSRLVYIVMDYIEGEDLQQVIRREKVIPEKTITGWFITLAEVLQYLHSRIPPIIYRDMKPSNVILQKNGRLVLIDFGIAREFKQTASNDTMYLGTIGFAAPEQFGAAQSDGRTDIYSLGMTMHYLATGKNPHEQPYGYIPVRELNPQISEKLEKIIEKCTKFDPKDRYQSAKELLEDLNRPDQEDPLSGRTGKIPVRTQEEKASSPKKTGLVAAVAALAVCVGAAVLFPRLNGNPKEPVSGITEAMEETAARTEQEAGPGTESAVEETPVTGPDESSTQSGNAGEANAYYSFPLAQTAVIRGMTYYPDGTEPEPNNRTIFRRLEEETNVHVEWNAYQASQWADRIALEMSSIRTLPEFVFNAGFGDADLLKYAKQGVILNLEDYIDAYMPNLKKILEQVPDYRKLMEDADGHIWALPWIEQLGYERTAIQTVDNMPYINKAWLDYLGLEVPETADEFEQVLIAFRDNAAALQREFNISGSVIPMSCIMNDGGQDPMILVNGFGEGIGDADELRHLAVNDDRNVICTASQEGFRKGLEWLHKLYAQNLIDPEAFTQEWSAYVAKGKAGRYGVCFTWDIANVVQVSTDDLIAGNGWIPLPALAADVTNITPNNGSFTSGFDRGRCVVTAAAQDPALVCAWLDRMYAPLQSVQNNWGTYGEA